MRAQLLIIALLPRIRCHCPKSRSAATKRALRLKAAADAIPTAEITNAVALLKERDKQCMVDDATQDAVRTLVAASREVRLGIAAAEQSEAIKALG